MKKKQTVVEKDMAEQCAEYLARLPVEDAIQALVRAQLACGKEVTAVFGVLELTAHCLKVEYYLRRDAAVQKQNRARDVAAIFGE